MFLYLFDKKTKSEVPNPTLLSQWIERKLSADEWEDLGISETKYRASFIPLFHKKILDREENAGRIGTTYGALKIFLTQAPVKKLVKDNINEYAEYYCRRLIARLGKKFLYEERKKDTTEIKKGYDLFIEEAGRYYSRALVEEISNKLMYKASKSNLKVREAASISYPLVLKILEKLFREKGDKVTYQKIRLQGLQNILLTIEGGLKENKSKLGEGESINPKSINLHIKSLGNARELVRRIYEDTK